MQHASTVTKVSDFEGIRLRIASPEEILSWSRGEVLKPETINYRTQRPEKDGLFDERIFGPMKDWECYCGKYRRIRYKGIVCDKCGVEVTRSIVRRERMGHIALATPVAHIWFVRGVPSKIGTLLDLSIQELERVIYFAGYIITSVNEEEKTRLLKDMEREYAAKLKAYKDSPEGAANIEELKRMRDERKEELRKLRPMAILSEMAFRDLSLRYGAIFTASTGAEALYQVCAGVQLDELVKRFEKEARSTTSLAQRKKVLKRLRLTTNLVRAGMRPEWMFLTMIPVMPPDLRPMVALDGGRYATSDVNDLYRRVINRNNRLKKLIELHAPEVIIRNEKRMLQEAADALIDNNARRAQNAQAQAAGQHRPLRSLADMLKGKQGRFRQNLLGKRVDYSGRSVIVVGPQLALHQCGLPKKMALELFKPFVIRKLIEREMVHNIRAASRLIEQEVTEVWAILEEVIQDKHVLLNRAPTLHRLGVQAFRPILIEGLAIELHPLVCAAFNADFDGDQMAVHVPLSDAAQREARDIMLSTHNLLKPATGEPIVTPQQDMVLGCYWMTRVIDGARGEGKAFGSAEEAIYAHHAGFVDLRARIKVRLTTNPSTKLGAGDQQLITNDQQLTTNDKKTKSKKKKEPESSVVSRESLVGLTETSIGRVLFNEVLPPEISYLNQDMNRGSLRQLSEEVIRRFGTSEAAGILDRIKNLGFWYATKSGITWGMDDLRIPPDKAGLMLEAEEQVSTVRRHYEEGLLTDMERRVRVIEIWTELRKRIAKLVPASLEFNGPIFSIFDSKSRGSWEQTMQMSGMKGLVVNPKSEIIELPVKSSYKEGINVLEYFISTHGARKGATDTALRTATAGYLTRRLVDVAQDLVIVEHDCNADAGVGIRKEDRPDHSFASRIFGRTLLGDILHPQTRSVLAKRGALLSRGEARIIEEAGAASVEVRLPITCRTKFGLCQVCYGYDLGHNRLVEIGEAVGIVTAQAIGEPGTQLTMRTFHTGGVAAAADITVGLPRVEEIFEARPPKGKATLCEVSGTVVEIIESEKDWKVRVLTDAEEEKPHGTATTHEYADIQVHHHEEQAGSRKVHGKEPAVAGVEQEQLIQEYIIGKGTVLRVKKENRVVRGEQLCDGNLDLKELYQISGREAVQRYIIQEVQEIYSSQGEGINDKHIELIIRKLFSRVRVKDPGDTKLLSSMIVEYDVFRAENDAARQKGGKPATAVRLLMGLTKVALTSDSFLAAASFQETAKVLIAAASEGKMDKLRGLKENVIIGKLIPAGTGLHAHREQSGMPA